MRGVWSRWRSNGTIAAGEHYPVMPEISEERRALLAKPHVRLYGSVNQAMYAKFLDELHAAPSDGPIVIAITTLGGDPEVARSMADDVRLLRSDDGRDILFVGKVAVYSAGATFMASFPIEDRYLTQGTRIMVHERSLTKTIELDGPLRTLSAKVKQVLNEIEQSIEIEEEGFREFIKGSDCDFEELREKAPENWYITCDRAKELGLIAEVI